MWGFEHRVRKRPSSKHGIEVGDFRPRFAGSCSAQPIKMRHSSFLPCRKENVACAMSLCYCPQSRRVFGRWHCRRTALDLNEDYLQGVAASGDASGRAMIFANCQHIDYTNGFSTRLSVERDKLPTCPRYNLSNAHLRHGYSPSSGACCFLLRLFPIHRHKLPLLNFQFHHRVNLPSSVAGKMASTV